MADPIEATARDALTQLHFYTGEILGRLDAGDLPGALHEVALLRATVRATGTPADLEQLDRAYDAVMLLRLRERGHDVRAT